MGVMFGNAALFGILTWYFDNVIPSNRGRGKSFLFPIYELLALCGYEGGAKTKKNILIKFKAAGAGE
jgi:hypothetical protein